MDKIKFLDLPWDIKLEIRKWDKIIDYQKFLDTRKFIRNNLEFPWCEMVHYYYVGEYHYYHEYEYLTFYHGWVISSDRIKYFFKKELSRCSLSIEESYNLKYVEFYWDED